MNRPFKLVPSRVYRTYTGGKLVEAWLGIAEPKDNHLPEAWIASVIEAMNPENVANEDNGLSKVYGTNYTLKDLIAENPSVLLGEAHVGEFGNSLGMLIKVLDSNERLTVQVHPDEAKAMKYFNSKFGKTEAWYILGERDINNEKPHIYLGFKPWVTREIWKECFLSQSIEKMLDCLHKIYVQKGDVFLVEGGIPHAIGAGCFLLEIQEPTDYTLRTEKKTPSGNVIPDYLCHQGLGYERMLDCFNYNTYSLTEILDKWSLKNSQGKPISPLITYNDTQKFALNLLTINGQFELDNSLSFYVLIVLEGKGILNFDGSSIAFEKGDQIFVPSLLEKININGNDVQIIQCFPPLVSNVAK